MWPEGVKLGRSRRTAMVAAIVSTVGCADTVTIDVEPNEPGPPEAAPPLADSPELSASITPTPQVAEIDLAAWRPLQPHSIASLAYDGDRERLVMVSGFHTWEWYGERWHPTATFDGPSARTGEAMVYDARRQRIVSFGGRRPNGSIANDTWEYDANGWVRVDVEGPPPRWRHTLAYDSRRGRVVLFGGEGEGEGFLGDTWEYDGEGWSEVKMERHPSSRADHVMTYDPARARVTLFGGRDQETHHDDTWQYDGRQWTEVATGEQSPLYHAGASVTWDEASQSVVLLAAVTEGERETHRVSTWLFDGIDWSLHLNAGVPPPGVGEIVYDSTTETATAVGSARRRWALVDGRWVRLRDSSRPHGRRNVAYAFDRDRGVVVAFGGDQTRWSCHTWEFDGDGWTRTESRSSPPCRTEHAMVYDRARQRTVLFGGSAGEPLGDTWSWDGTTWSRIASATSPAPRSRHALAYDPTHDDIVMYGGEVQDADGLSTSYEGDTWKFDGSTWVQILPDTSPASRAGHAMSFSERLGGVVLVGGRETGSDRILWVFDGTTWSPASPHGTPLIGPSADVDIVQDEAGETLVLLGPRNTTYEWRPGDTSMESVSSRGLPSGALIYDDARARLLVVSGDVWERRGSGWTPLHRLVLHLPGYTRSSATYDDVNRRVAVFAEDTIWTLDGVRWSGLPPRGQVPQPEEDPPPTLLYRAAREDFVLVGWPLGLEPWSLRTWLFGPRGWSGGSGFSIGRLGHAMAYDSKDGEVVLFGGLLGLDPFLPDATTFKLTDTWELAAPATRPTERWGHVMSYDPTRDRIVLVGGKGLDGEFLPETWEYDGQSWNQITTASAPSADHLQAMVYDRSVRRTVLVTRSGDRSETWEYDGSDWTRLAAPNTPHLSTVTFDRDRGRVLGLAGGVTHELIRDPFE